MRSDLCYMCSLDTCFNVYKNNNALWLVLFVFTRHMFEGVQQEICALAYVTRVH
jgi:hypothetical protein